MQSLKFHTRFNPPASVGVTATGGLTQQHFKDECDLNNILRHYNATGVPPPNVQPIYADMTRLPTTLSDAFEFSARVDEWFNTLPSKLRETFGNDPRNALRLINDNPQAAIAAGLLPTPRSSDGVSAPAGEANHSKAAEAATPEPQKEAAKATKEP